MKYGAVAWGVVGISLISSGAWAQDGARAPHPRRGFQMALRTGYSLPLAEAADGTNLSDFSSGQVPFIVDLGSKLIPELFLGGWVGVAVGGAGGGFDRLCQAANTSCRSLGVSVGLEVQYHILPDAVFNPWLGYGLGYETLRISSDSELVGNTSFGGVQFARLMAGGDVRMGEVFGLGPFIDFSIGRYNTVNFNAGERKDISNAATHGWLTFGLRGVLYP